MVGAGSNVFGNLKYGSNSLKWNTGYIFGNGERLISNN